MLAKPAFDWQQKKSYLNDISESVGNKRMLGVSCSILLVEVIFSSYLLWKDKSMKSVLG